MKPKPARFATCRPGGLCALATSSCVGGPKNGIRPLPAVLALGFTEK